MPVSAQMGIPSRTIDGIRILLERLSNPRPAELQRIEAGVRYGFAGNFQRQSIGGGGAWLPLAPRTVRERRAAGYGGTGPILRRTGAYARSWTGVGGWTMLSRSASEWTLHVSSDHPYAFTHELGNRGRRIPPRPVRYLDTGATRTIAGAIEGWVDDVIRQVMT